MAFAKSPQTLIDLFDEALPRDPLIERRKMFGCPCAFVNGNMYAGVFEDRIFARFSPDDRAALEAEGARPFEPLAGRASKSSTELPEHVMADDEAVAQALARSFAFVSVLPPKEKKEKPKRAKKSR